jgi:hypothetical protein
MDVVLGVILVTIGVAMIVYGPRIARARISLHYSYEQLHATSGKWHRRVRRNTLIATTLNILVGAAFVAGGINGLLG